MNTIVACKAVSVDGYATGPDEDLSRLLHAQTDGILSVNGAALATQLLHAKLLDELLLWAHPTIPGFGRPRFDDHDVPIELDLLEQRSFEQGVKMHRYAIHDESEASLC